jgi:hypothetical protein
MFSTVLSGKNARPWTRCGTCGIPIDRKTASKIIGEAKRENIKALSIQKKDFQRRISGLKVTQKKALAKLAISSRQAISRVQRIAEEKARNDRMLFDQEFSRLKSIYQISLAQIKELQARQNTVASSEIKEIVGTSFEESKQVFNQLVQSNQARMLEFQAWLQQELPRHLVQNLGVEYKAGEQEESESEQDNLVRELGLRDELIEQAQERITKLEGELSSKQRKTIWKRMRRASPTEPYKEEEDSDPQQEILKMIREIAEERTQMESARKVPEQRKLPQFVDSFGSRMSRKPV